MLKDNIFQKNTLNKMDIFNCLKIKNTFYTFFVKTVIQLKNKINFVFVSESSKKKNVRYIIYYLRRYHIIKSSQNPLHIMLYTFRLLSIR